MTQGKLTKDDLNPQFRAEIVDLITNGNAHIGSTISSETGVHGIRHHNNELSILKGSVWEQITTGSNVQLHIGHLDNALTTGLYTVMGPLSLTDGSPIEVFETDKTLIEVFAVGEGQIMQRFTVFTGAPSIERYMRCKLDNQWLVDYPLTVGVVINGWIRENVPLSNSYSSTSDKTAASSKVVNILYDLINGHMEDPDVHLRDGEREKIYGAFQKSGGEITGKITSLLSATDSNAWADAGYEVRVTKGVDNKNSLPRIALHSQGNGVAKQIAGDHIRGGVSVLNEDGESLARFNCGSIFVDGVDLKQSASDVKTNVASAITDKGVPTSPTATGAQMAANIRAIKTGKQVVEGTFNVPAVQIGQTINIPVATVSFNPRNIVTPIVGSKMVHGKIWQGIGQYFHSPLIYVTGSGPYNITMDVKNPGPGVPPASTTTYTITE